MNRKGMNAVLMVVVTAVVLLMTALTLIFITQGGLSNFLKTAQGEGAKGVCNSNRDQYCNTVGNGYWDSMGVEYADENCDVHLEQQDAPYYNCSEETGDPWVQKDPIPEGANIGTAMEN